MELILASLGLAIVAGTLFAIFWSIAHPSQRLWPPKRYSIYTPLNVWIPTFSLFGILIALGLLGWGDYLLPKWIRFGIGLPLIIAGNIAVWSEVKKFGVAQTGGARGKLRTEGLYRFSRNPQYLADIAMIVGWIMLSCAPWAFFLGIPAISILIAAPFSEEPWLREQYGLEFEQYASRVRRFF